MFATTIGAGVAVLVSVAVMMAGPNRNSCLGARFGLPLATKLIFGLTTSDEIGVFVLTTIFLLCLVKEFF